FYNIEYNDIKICNILPYYEQDELLYYVINFTDNGFVLLAADDNVFPVLGYSFESNYLNTELPPAFSAWLTYYKNQLISVKQKGLTATESIEKVWNKYLEFNPDDYLKSVTQQVVAPLLTCNWSQKYSYNAYCPADPAGYGGHAIAGCVAVAMAQVLYYFRFPEVGEDSCGYQSDYGYEFADFGNTNYKWNEMVNTIYNMSNPAIAELVYHVGVSVEMDYGAYSSSANAWDTRDALVNYFRYSDEANFLSMIDLEESFNDSLIACLDKQIPLIYRGGDLMMSHAFVCDGYQDSSFFHFNWGWAGQYNGYFNIDTLVPGGYDFTFNQAALFNIYPREDYPTYCLSPDTLTASRGTFSDGSGSLHYENNAICQWLITPENPAMTNIQLWFSKFETELDHDFVTVYDGPTDQYPVLGVFSGSQIPPHITSSGNEMLVVFQTNETSPHNGWLAEYLAYSGPFCNPLTTYTDTTRMYFTDVSGPYQYLANSDCQWLLAPQSDVYDSISAVKLFFHNFDLADDDTLFVYDGDSPNAPVLEKLTGDLIPEQIESSGNKIVLQFKTNEVNSAGGWAAGYKSILPVYCKDTVVMTEVAGVFEDGSGDKKYGNNAECYWLIEPEGAEVITLKFDEFDLEFGYDQLIIYNATEYPPVKIATFWGHELPDPFTMQGNRMLVRFTTDLSQTFDGWKISYTSIEPYIDEQNNNNLFELFPNPVGDQLHINISPELMGCKYSIFTITGKSVKENIFINESNIINTENLKKGIYYIMVISDSGIIFKKFIK
ncbi:MAG: C10 family peptidase, partial [Bacteroidales bacterium]|nr:C10 family peptidase [Bacteroidales bacterium]